jgi:hypothetical protein
MKHHLYWLLGLSIAGLLFSGYLSAVKLITNSCALGESCPYFLGRPACWYGFAMYVILTLAVIWALAKPSGFKKSAKAVVIVSGLGVIFSGSFVVQEISLWMRLGHILPYAMGLPTCAYGLIFYVAIFVTGIASLRSANKPFVPIL